ncbi:MAG: immunoglobulin domain-containing protein, partial [Verrucomicrobia bacterium]|nr:immunoglobulin domain-containing protein [Verrucomicrobiota bacterium]
ITSRVAPVFVQVFDPSLTNKSSTNAVVSVAMSTNNTVPGSVWVNHHAGSEGGGISRTVDRQFLALEGYTGNILSSSAAKPSTDFTVFRGIVTLDAFTNAVDVYSSQVHWFGIPVGASTGTQDNPTGIASTDGTNFWGTGNFAGTSGELDGTLFYNPAINGGTPVEVQNYVQAAAEARIIGGTLYVVVPGTGVINFIDPASQSVVPLPWTPNVANPYFNFAFTNLYLNWGSTFKKVANFDMNAAGTIAYGADQTFGIVKFTNNAGTWVQSPYFFTTTNIGTTAQVAGSQGCFGICVDFNGTNPVIYATTMESGAATNLPGGFGVNTAQGHQNNNRLIRIVDTGINPGTNLVAQTLATAATTNEFFGGIDFTPDLTPLITSNPANYGTTNGGSAPFSVAAQSVYALNYQWLQNGTNLDGATSATLTLSGLDTTFNNFTYQCVVTNNYGSVTSAVAVLTVTALPVIPVITSGTNNVTGYIGSGAVFAPVSATGTEPFTYQWYFGSNALVDGQNGDGSGYFGSQTASLTVTNIQLTEAGSYYLVVMNSAGYASNKVDVLTANYHLATINAGQPASVITFVGVPTSITANQSGGTAPIANQWYKGTTLLTDAGEYGGTTTPTLTIAASVTNDSGTNYYIVVSNPAGSVTSSLATVSVLIPPPLSSVAYTNQLYFQNFDSLPDPGGVSVNSINNPLDNGSINGVAYSLANPFDFNYPVITTSYVGGLGLSSMKGWYGAADTLANAVYPGIDGITRFGAQDGDQSTGGVIDFGLLDVNGGTGGTIVGTNRALGLITTSTTGSTTFALKLVNTTTNALNYIHLNFLGELWRNNKNPKTISFGYALDDTATNFVLDTQSISNCTQVPGLAFSFETNINVTVVDGTQPSNQVNLVTNSLPLSSAWHTNGALWLIWSMNTTLNAGSGQGYAIDNLQVSGTTVPTTVPTATTTAATKLTSTAGQMNATINPSNGPTAYWFQYGLTTSYGSSTPTNLLGVVSGPLAVLEASVNPNNQTANYWFKYGLTSSYGSFTTTNSLASGSSPVIVSNVITGLTQGTTYHYQIVASTAAGTSSGSDKSFITPVVTAPNLTGVTISGGVFQLAFTNAAGASFSVLATNNLTAPRANWPVVGHPVEIPAGSGSYLFTNSAPTNAQLYYILRQP